MWWLVYHLFDARRRLFPPVLALATEADTGSVNPSAYTYAELVGRLANPRLAETRRVVGEGGHVNGFWRDDTFEPAPDVHIGVAISPRGGGLVAPAIHDVCTKKLDELMGDLTDLVARARAGSLRSSEMSDPTITVTNLGDQGVDTVFGVIYPQQVALVGFGKPAQRVSVIDGAESASPPRCTPRLRRTTGRATATVARCSSPRSTSCCTSPNTSRLGKWCVSGYPVSP